MGLPDRRATFERLISEHLGAALRFAVRLTGRVDTAEEVVQEAMLRASRSWKSFRGASQFRTWLFRIVINAFRDQISRSPEQSPLAPDVVDEKQILPIESAAADELGAIVAKHVSSLPPRQREVLILSAYEGLAPRQIAELLETSEANVHSTLSLARARLRKSLAKYLAEK